MSSDVADSLRQFGKCKRSKALQNLLSKGQVALVELPDITGTLPALETKLYKEQISSFLRLVFISSIVCLFFC